MAVGPLGREGIMDGLIALFLNQRRRFCWKTVVEGWVTPGGG